MCYSFLQSVQQKCFDHVSAIYHLLADKMEATAKQTVAVPKSAGKFSINELLSVSRRSKVLRR